ncbi:TMV resistance protein N-like [Pyrus ussuriensis x Pyrus communis]|uniref:TMV resistance protein N-like n=1 Tax=Pyrus ussuriensis x Pyrus communis TaxID=2448454 RepID=A0A5N5G7V8_9ROSA|nr:TMV resistance protein N-like [Pyrus ussuriensis x Pyrus communis]
MGLVQLEAMGQDWQGWEPRCKIDTIRSLGDRSRAIGSRGSSRHICEHGVGAGLGQVVHIMRNWTTKSVMFGYW